MEIITWPRFRCSFNRFWYIDLLLMDRHRAGLFLVVVCRIMICNDLTLWQMKNYDRSVGKESQHFAFECGFFLLQSPWLPLIPGACMWRSIKHTALEDVVLPMVKRHSMEGISKWIYHALLIWEIQKRQNSHRFWNQRISVIIIFSAIMSQITY